MEKRYDFVPTKETIRKIDSFLPKLKYSVLPSKIIKWLENFEESDIPYIYDLLQVFEYITFTELQYRLEEQLEKLLSFIPDNEKVLIIPYAKIGKSATLITYPLSHTDVFKRSKKRLIISYDIKKHIDKIKHIVFLDDFIGSGKTFCDEFNNKFFDIIRTNDIEKIYLLASIIMESGLKKIMDHFAQINIGINVCAEERKKIFNKTHSPLLVFNNLKTIKKIVYKYGQKIPVVYDNSNPALPYGYQKTESLIAFTHGTPNNTLSIFWGDKKWFPLFPRRSTTRMDEARKIKKEIAFYIGICNRLGIDLYSQDSIFVYINGKKKRKIKYNSKTNHSLVTLIKLKIDGYDDIKISHLLGLTMKELDKIYKEGINRKFIDYTRQLTHRGEFFYNQLRKKTRSEIPRKITEDNLIYPNMLYLPRQFKGKT